MALLKRENGSDTIPLHLFDYQGMSFVFHPALGEPIRISSLARDYLNEIMVGGSSSTVAPKDESLKYEVGVLKGIGFFNPYRLPIPTDAEAEKLLAQRYSSPWTKLELALSETCNLACRYCYCGTCRDEIPNRGLMSESVARQAINWLFAVSGKSKEINITFFGGEPLLNKPVLKFAIAYSQRLARLHEKKVFYSMTTNGTLFDDEVISLIKRYNFGLMVSLDGPKDLHNGQCPTRDGEDSYDLAVAGIKKLMARRRRVTVRCTMAHPAPNMLELIRFFDLFGFSRIVLGRVFNPVYPSPCDMDKQDFQELERQMNEEVVPWMLKELKEERTPKYYPFSSVVEKNPAEEAGMPISPFRCGACRGTTTVGADGTLYPCHRFVGMKNWIVGSVSNGPDIHRCKDFWRKYRSFVKTKCFNCWAYTLCKGPCPWEAARADGTFKLNESTCAETKTWIMQGAWFKSLAKCQCSSENDKGVEK